MNFELPADARVQIFIAPNGAFPIPEGVAVPSVLPAPRPRRGLLKGTAFVALLFGAFVLGGHAARQAGVLQAHAQSPDTQVPSAQRDQVESRQVPPAFTRQLQQPPTVTPAPGAAPSAAAAKSAFGLQD